MTHPDDAAPTATIGDLLSDADPPPTGERFETLCRMGRVEIERIVSSARPDPTEYVQAQDEWVVVMRGAARIDVAGRVVELAPGGHVHLPAGMPHTVLHTEPGTIWLAVHVHPESNP